VILGVCPPVGLSATNVLRGRVSDVRSNGTIADIRIDVANASLLARVTERSVAELGIAPGRDVFALIKTVVIEAYSSARM
jgi:molybdate transport system ATP-binding protein